MTKKQMTPEERIQAEKRELDILIDNGFSFDIEMPVTKKAKSLKGLLGKKVKQQKIFRLNIYEPTLSTLDRIAAEQINIKIDEQALTSENGVPEAWKLARDNAKAMAKIIAIAALGQDYLIPVQGRNGIQYQKDDKRLDELTEMIYHSVKPKRLIQLVTMINGVSNLGDFCNSIRLIAAQRSTMPNLIEGKKED